MTLVVFHLQILFIFSLSHSLCTHFSVFPSLCPSWQMFRENSESDMALSLGGVGVVSVMSLIEKATVGVNGEKKSGTHHFLLIVSPVTPRPPHD